MFLPEEIGPARAGLAAGETELGLLPVSGVLDWVYSRDD